MPPLRIFIIDSDPYRKIGEQVKNILCQRLTYVSELVDSWQSLIQHSINSNPDLIIPVISSFEQSTGQAIFDLRNRFSSAVLLPIINPTNFELVSCNFDFQSNDFITLPITDFEVVTRVQRLVATSKERELKKSVCRDHRDFGLEQLLGEAPAFTAVKRRIPLVARSESTVLLSGETGTGKEIFARTLHYVSRRAGKPFLPVNCGAIPLDLFERELFGHHKGAYTSAWAAQPGLIEEAEGGTLFLDEIETLSLPAQVKLLRFLQDETYHSLGSSKLKQADVWIIASTNADLNSKVQKGTFREDLFYRLAVMTLTLPPLRTRRSDIPLLVNHFLTRYSEKDYANPSFSPAAMDVLRKYAWPGNVRQLENVIRQAVALTETNLIQIEDLPIMLSSLSNETKPESFRQIKERVIQEFEKSYVTELLELYDGNVTRAALAAKKERRSFGRLVKKYNLEKR